MNEVKNEIRRSKKKEEINMTEIDSFRNAIVTTAERFKGAETGSRLHKIIVDVYNDWFNGRFPRNAPATYTSSWCHIFVDAIGIIMQTIEVIPNECGCWEAVKIAKAAGTWREKNYTPKPADIIYFKYSTGYHVGYVAEVKDGYVYTVEGNAGTPRQVCLKQYALTDPSILGYCAPDYAAVITNEPEKPKKPEGAEAYDAAIAGTYTVTTGLYLRKGPGTGYGAAAVMPKNAVVEANGWYKTSGSTKWAYVLYNGLGGFCSKKYLKEK